MTAEQLGLFEAPRRAKVEASGAERLEQCAAVCKQCMRCDELVGNRTQVVYASGNADAKIMLVGEAPGQNEDETGMPFVGRAGQLLNKILASVGFDRDRDLYVTNMVKCRPPGNRTPTQAEMDNCATYLQEQFATVKPQIVLLAGATAVKGILKSRDSMTKLRGKWIEKNHLWYMPIFHPAYLLRNESREPGSPKWLMWQDIQEVRRKYEELQAGN